MTMAAIARAVAERFGVPSGLLFTACRQHQISHPRQVAMYLCRKHTNNSLAAIGRFFGGKNHTTVMHALRHVEHELSVNFELRRFVEVFSEQCRDPPIRMGSPIVLPAEIPAEIPAHLKKPGALKAAIALRDELAVSEKYPGSVIPDEDRDYEKAFDEIFGCEKASFSAPLEELLKMRYEEKCALKAAIALRDELAVSEKK